jgi:hypothetical protein
MFNMCVTQRGRLSGKPGNTGSLQNIPAVASKLGRKAGFFFVRNKGKERKWS